MWLDYLRAAVLLVTLAVAGLYDWRYREIPVRLWAPALIIGVAIDGYCYLSSCLSVAYLGFSGAIAGVVAIMAFLGAVGGADMLASIAIAVLLPEPPALPWLRGVLPPIVTLLLYYGVASLALVLRNVVANLLSPEAVRSVNAPLSRKFLLLISARPMRVSDFLRTRFYYPLYVPGVLSRAMFGIEEDDAVWRERLRRMVSDGVLNPDDFVLATWGIPTVTMLAVSLALYLVVGDLPVLKVLELLLRTRL